MSWACEAEASAIQPGAVVQIAWRRTARVRHVGKLNTRVLWFFTEGRRIIAVHGIRNKGQAIPERDLRTAKERMRDWQERMK